MNSANVSPEAAVAAETGELFEMTSLSPRMTGLPRSGEDRDVVAERVSLNSSTLIDYCDDDVDTGRFIEHLVRLSSSSRS